MSTAEAPSEIWLLDAAVITPSSLNAGRSEESFSMVELRLGPSSVVTVIGLPSGALTFKEMISRSK